MELPRQVRLVEVGPRDGLQSLQRTYPLEIKARMVDTLARAGLTKIEVSAFARPDVIPQLADAEALFARIERVEGCVYRGHVPNMRGAQRALAAGADELVALVTASETYSRKNQNMTVEEAVRSVIDVAELARTQDVPTVVAIGMAMFCPYEGDIPASRVLGLVERLADAGVDGVYLATSVGVDGPRVVGELCSRVLDRWPELPLALHLHNTNGMALANALAGLDAGVREFEGSICGIGGGIRMPYGMPHFGNIATEDLAHFMAELGIATGLDVDTLLKAGRQITELLELESPFSSALRGGTKAAVLDQGRMRPR